MARKQNLEPVTLASIHTARARIGEAIHVSPCHLSHHLSELAGLPLHLKLENLQRTGSFKERGALNKLLTLNEAERKRGVIAASAGNHAQGVAFHAAARGIRAQIVMPLATPQVKVAATRGYGAEVILHGASYDEACEEALRRRVDEGRTFIHPFDDAEVISGQGTIGLELLEQVPGSGSGGGADWRRRADQRRGLRAEGDQSAHSRHRRGAGEAALDAARARGRRAGDAGRRSHGRRRHRRSPGRRPHLPLVSRYVDEIVTVDDEEIASAILMLLEQEKTLAEGAGAAALAAVVQAKTNLRHRRTVVLVCGGNIDVTLLAKIIERGLVKDGRLLRIRVYLQDRPGALLALTKILARERANIVETVHNRAYYGVSLGETVIDVTIETRGATHITAIHHALREAGFRFERIQ